MFEVPTEGLTDVRGRNGWFDPRRSFGWVPSEDHAALCLQSRRMPSISPVVIQGSVQGLCVFLRRAADAIEAEWEREKAKDKDS